MSDSYKYKLEECDIEDKSSLLAFRKKRLEWIHLLEADSRHAIWTQITHLIWDDAVYRTINEARSYSSEESPAAAASAFIGNFIDSGYVALQVLGISRLTDASDPKKPERGVVSLRRLLDDLVTHKHLLTRENVVCYDGIPFDSDRAAEQFYSKHGYPEGEFRRLPSRGPEAFSASERAHQAFDEVSGVSKHNRSRTDLVDDRVFETIRWWLDCDVINKFRMMRHKFLAHAADELSRISIPLDEFGITMNEVAEAQQKLVWAARAIGTYILYDTWHAGPVPIAHWNTFANLDKPFVPRDKLKGLRKFWEIHEAEWKEHSRVPIDLVNRKAKSS